MTDEKPNPCYCGHDCSRCYVYLGTKLDSDEYISKAKEFYRSEFGFDIPEDKLICSGGRSDRLFYMCKECPFRSCCIGKNLNSCRECENYPCEMLAKYTEKYVNKAGQIQKNHQL